MAESRRGKLSRELSVMVEEAIVDAHARPSLMWLADRAVGLPDPIDPDDNDEDFPSEFTHRQRDLIAAGFLFACDWTDDTLGMDIDELVERVSDGQPLNIDDTQTLCLLPAQFFPRIDLAWAERFAKAASAVTARFRGDWSGPRNVAEELATRIVVANVGFHLELWRVRLSNHWVGNVSDVLFEDLDHQELYSAAGGMLPEVAARLGAAPMGFDDLFTAFRDTEPIDY